MCDRCERMSYLEYEHHGRQVKVRADLKDRHREHCLCYVCVKFKPKLSTNCPIAQATYEHCVRFGITTPVWECPEFMGCLHGSLHCEDVLNVSAVPEKPVEDRGLLTDDVAISRYFAFIAGGLFGIFMGFAIPALVALVTELFGVR